ncbi:MAG: VWA domain-containing protein, partial [Pyrinomonadaceae bacterium]
MARILIFLMLMVACLFAATVSAQDKKAEPDDVVRIDTELVDVPVVVTDRAGKPVLNLKQKNFVVYEDNAKQDVTDFAATNAPFEVAVLLDTSGSTRSELDLIKRAAQQFVDSLRPGDRVAIVAFKSGVEGSRTVPAAGVLCPLASDRNVLR